MDSSQVLELITESMNAQEPRSGGVHVSSICAACLRKSWYGYRLGEFNDITGIRTLWFGRAMHASLNLKGFLKEQERKWENIVGTIDFFNPDQKIIVDFKTHGDITRQLPMPSHVQQVECYSLLNEKCGFGNIEQGFIAYFSKQSPYDVRICKAPLRPMENVEKQMVNIAGLITSDKIPPRQMGWLCKYCPFSMRCFGNTPDKLEMK